MSEREFIITDHAPKVWLAGHTTPDWGEIQEFLEYRGRKWVTQYDPNNLNDLAWFDPLSVIEFGGKVCYDSFHNPGKKTQTEYISQSIIENEHGSVLEHATFNFAVASLPRSTQLELVRHRAGMGYSFRSTRFTDSFLEFIIPPLLRNNEQLKKEFCIAAGEAYAAYCNIADSLGTEDFGEDISKTLARKRVKEAARSVLPNCLGSDGLVTMNGRSLRHFIAMRTDPHADASIREFAFAVYEAAVALVPALFVDSSLVEQDFGTPQVLFKHPKV